MDSTWSALIGAVASLIVFVGGAVASTLKDRGKDRAQAVTDARAAVQDLLQAAFETKAMLATWEARWRDKRGIASAVVRSAAQVVAGLTEDRVYHGMAQGLESAMAWRREVDAAAEAVVIGPGSRMAAAAARIAMLEDHHLREAAAATTAAIGALMSAFGEKPSSTARTEAEQALDEALVQLSDAARSYNGRPRTS
ncbi:hypothetical protein ACWDO7_22545 [Streptomyces sp. NPDC003656]